LECIGSSTFYLRRRNKKKKKKKKKKKIHTYSLITVALLRLVSPGAATDGVTLFFYPKK